MIISTYRIAFTIGLMFLSLNNFSQNKNDKISIETPNAILEMNLQKHIRVLASLEAQNNSSIGNFNDVKSMAYLAAQYKYLGLQPLGDSNRFTQSFKINEGLEIKPSTLLSVNGIPLKTGTDYWPFSFCSNTSFSGNANWRDMEQNEPFLYDIKEVVQANKANGNFDLSQYIYDKAKDLGKKKMALLVYNSSDTNDNLSFLPNDTSAVLPVPVIYLTKSGIQKMMNESTISNALEGHFSIGKNVMDAHNLIGYIDNGAQNTVFISSHLNQAAIEEAANNDNNASGAAAVLELARLLKGLSAAGTENKKASSISTMLNYKKNNYCFIIFSGENKAFNGSEYFIEHPPFELSKINYMININKIGDAVHVGNLVVVGGVKSASNWPSLLHTYDTLINLKTIDNLSKHDDLILINHKNIPILNFEIQEQPRSIVEAKNAVKIARTINYILQLIGRTNAIGKLTFIELKN